MARRSRRTSRGLEGLEEHASARMGFKRRQAKQESTLVMRLSLGFVACCRPLYRLLGVDHAILTELVRTKWMLDHRRRRVSSEGGISGLQLVLTLLMYLGLGLGLGLLAFAMGEERELYVSVVSSAVCLLMFMPLLADFSVVLFDTSDVELLASLPIDDRTLTASRVTMMLSYLGLLLAALGLGPLLLGAIALPSLGFVPIMLLGLLQAAALAMALVLILYLTALKTLDLARFRDALVYLQGFTVIAFLALLQLGPRLADRMGIVAWVGEHAWVQLCVPTLAPAALWRLTSGSAEPDDLTLLLTGMGATLLLLACCAYLARDGIVNQLAQMEASGGRALGHAKSYGISGRLGRRAPTSMQRAGWFFFLAQAGSDRTFKLRVMPMLAMVILPLLGAQVSDLAHWRDLLPYLALVPYVLLLQPGAYWEMGRFAESWEGAWIFDDLSESEKHEFCRGAMQAVLARTLLAPCAVLALLLLLLGLTAELPSFLCASGMALGFGLWVLPRYGASIPFTQRPVGRAGGVRQNLLLGCGSVLAVFLLAGTHHLLRQVPYAMTVGAPLALLLAAWKWKRFPHVEFRQRSRRSRRQRKAS